MGVESRGVETPAKMPIDLGRPAVKGGGSGKQQTPPKFRHSRVFHPPLNPDGRQRDIFPLPTLRVENGVANKLLSRSVQKRIHFREAIIKRANRAISALNSLYYGRDDVMEPFDVSDLRSLPLIQRDALLHVLQAVKAAGKPPPGLCHTEALKALRVPGSSYQEATAGVGDVVEMDLNLLSIPSLAGRGVDLGSSLEGDIGEMVRDFESHLLQDDDTWAATSGDIGSAKPYNDPKLVQRGFYSALLQKLQQSGALTFIKRPRGRVGVFCVSKKAKEVEGKMVQRQRLILDCRQTNRLFRTSPLTELGSLASLCEGHLDEGQSLFIGGGDLKDCFYACHIDPSLSELSALQRISLWVRLSRSKVKTSRKNLETCLTITPFLLL